MPLEVFRYITFNVIYRDHNVLNQFYFILILTAQTFCSTSVSRMQSVLLDVDMIIHVRFSMEDLCSFSFNSCDPGSAALPSNIKYFGSARTDEVYEEEEDDYNQQTEPVASSYLASSQVTPRKSKAQSGAVANGHGTFCLFYLSG